VNEPSWTFKSFEGDSASLYLGEIASVNLENIQSTFSEVFTRLPDEVTIYPSENYLYYRFHTNHREMWGNIRLSPDDRDQGIVHFAYYEFNPSPENADDFYLKYKALSPEDGLIVDRKDAFQYSITFEGRTVIFDLYQLDQSSPKLFKPAPNEVIVFKTYDESRFQFFLIFNEATNRFMYILNEEESVPDQLIPVGPDVAVGRKSGFAFYIDRPNQNRKILMGIFIENVKQNNYYDGPFDQLADNYIDENSKLSEYIQLAYPYTRNRVDRYGKFIGMAGSRVAITPYASFDRIEELTEIVDWCRYNEVGIEFYSCIAYDDKVRFGIPSGVEEIDDDLDTPLVSPLKHEQSISDTWPPGHEEKPSKSWTTHRHDPVLSKNWPANHDYKISSGWSRFHLPDYSKIWPPNHYVSYSEGWGFDHSEVNSSKWPANHIKAVSVTWPPDHSPAPSRSWPPNHKSEISKKWPQGHNLNPSKHWPQTHTVFRSQSWPPNHKGTNSGSWVDHSRDVSKGWPANHREKSSSQWDPNHDVDRSQRWPPNHNVTKSENIP